MRRYELSVNRAPFIAMGLFSILFGSCSKQPAQMPAAKQPQSKFHAGQVWSFKTPPTQPNARLTILRVEDGGKVGTIIHVALSGVSYGNGQTQISHLPFSESAIEQSVISLEQESGSIPDYAEGYRLWREAFETGKGGVFSIPVAQAFDAVTGIANNHR